MSHAQKTPGSSTEGGLMRWVRHPFGSEIPSEIPPSPHVSATTMPHLAQDCAGVLVKFTVPRSAVLKSWRTSNAEYLVRGGTRVVSAEVVAGAMPSFGATARWAAEIGAATGSLGVGGGYAASWVGEKIIEAKTPDYTETGNGVPLLPALAILAGILWFIGWMIPVALFLRDEAALRRKIPARQSHLSPVPYILFGAFFGWWADLYLRLRERRGRRDVGRRACSLRALGRRV